jgi:PAS domain S-box-containing protein
MKESEAPRGSRGKVAELAVASAVLLIATALPYLALERQLEDLDSITRTHSVLEKLSAVRGDVAEISAGERGYLLSGEGGYLGAYGQGVRDLRRNLDELRELTGDNPDLRHLDQLVVAQLESLDDNIQVRHQQPPKAKVSVLREVPGNQQMEEINVLLAGMTHEKDRQLVQGSHAVRSNTSKTRMSMGVLAGLTVIFILTAGRVVQKESRERKRVEEQFRTLVEFAPDAIVIVNQNGEIVLVNAQTEKVFGYSRRELFRQRVEMLMPLRFHQQHVGHRSGFFANPKIRPIGAGLELYGLRKDGAEFPVEVSLSPLEMKEGRLVACAVRDITDRKLTQEALRHQAEGVERHRRELATFNAELTAANQELEAFSYSVSHDLRGPLRSIDGFSLALLEDCGDKLDAQGKDYLHRVRASTQRMGVLIDDILNLSQVTRAEMRHERVDLSGIARSVLSELAEAQPDRHVEVKIKERLNASGDSRLLRIALENLLGNAWKFTSKMEAAHIQFDEAPSNGTPIFYVRDDGAGFDSAYAKRMFGAFQRLHDKDEFPGTGIGLATVQRIVHRHGGRIWAEGVVGGGATFYFTLAETRR